METSKAFLEVYYLSANDRAEALIIETISMGGSRPINIGGSRQ